MGFRMFQNGIFYDFDRNIISECCFRTVMISFTKYNLYQTISGELNTLSMIIIGSITEILQNFSKWYNFRSGLFTNPGPHCSKFFESQLS